MSQIIITTSGYANIRSEAKIAAGNIIGKAYPGEIRAADDAAVAGWFALTDVPAPAYVSKQVAQVYTSPAPLAYVPYLSQWTSKASRQADCGATCCAMLATWRGVPRVPDDFKIASDAAGHTTAGQLVQNLATVGLAAKVIDGADLPPENSICLVTYAGFDRANVQDTGFTGLHWLIYLGYDAARDEVIVQDPNWWQPCASCGDRKRYSKREWAAAWKAVDGTRQAVVLI